ncbi:MAG: NAD(FAD)-utilizing dehydrogenase [Bacillota bacterium]|nr:NAD(FAD)-utilizing dehydrogenase [Bacillota bacterium]
MIRVSGFKIRVGKTIDDMPLAVEKYLKLPAGTILSCNIVKESIDAREKPNIYKVYTLDISSDLEDEYLIDAAKRNRLKVSKSETEIYKPEINGAHFEKRPVVVGFGPCGMFAALVLAMAGAKTIVLERGAAMEERIKDVENFWNGGELKENSNVQFGEGGAGTFSDGKLTTGTKNRAQSFVLKTFVDAGASKEIMYKQHPHIGTDVIRKAVVNIRKEIESLGGEVRFNTKWVPGLIDTDCTILAIGHSARDTFKDLLDQNYMIEQKPFSIGVRVEHTQETIDMAQYGAKHQELGIGPAEYKLNCKIDDRGVYTFCMCPGGEVVDSSSEKNTCVTNGMSYSSRDGEFANAAVLCDVRTEDFGSVDPLAGAKFQQKYEELAYINGNGKLPKGEAAFNSLPDFASKAIKSALIVFGRKLKGFDKPVNIYGIESRSSSPIRIKRDANGEALASNGLVISGVYPGGEGAGYAGGIMSSACDGVRLAEFAIRKE